MSPKDVLALVKEKGLKIVDIKFVDLPGTWQHFSIPAVELDEDVFKDGLGFDGSSIRGFQAINESDMLLIPDPDTAIVDPVCKVPTLSMICDIQDPLSRKPYSRDPRYIAKKAEEYVKTTGIGDTIFFGPEAEFFIFNSIAFDSTSHSAFYEIDSEEGIWNSGEPGLGYRPRYKEGYFPVPPVDKLQDLRSEMILKMIDSGIRVEVQHHEVGTAGQAEIDMRFQTLTKMADQLLLYKYIVKNVAVANGYTATFMPKPLFGDNGSGMHCHQSIWKEGTNTFYDPKGYAMISDTCRWYIGGLLKHIPSILAFAAPTTNSYRRLVPGFEAPVNLMYSARNRSACVRIPMYSNAPAAKRLELRIPDPSCNPYLAFPAMLLAGLDGIQNKIEPPTPLEKDLYDLEPEEAAQIKQAPGSLDEVLNALETDHDYLLKGDVFTKDVIDTWIEFKRSQAVQIALRPHPWEFHLYYDV